VIVLRWLLGFVLNAPDDGPLAAGPCVGSWTMLLDARDASVEATALELGRADV
jgi:hypothetical protein